MENLFKHYTSCSDNIRWELINVLKSNPASRISLDDKGIDIIQPLHEIPDHFSLLHNPRTQGKQVMYPISVVDAGIITEKDLQFLYKKVSPYEPNQKQEFVKTYLSTLIKAKTCFHFTLSSLTTETLSSVIGLETRGIQVFSRTQERPKEPLYAHVSLITKPFDKLQEEQAIAILKQALKETIEDNEQKTISFSIKNIYYN